MRSLSRLCVLAFVAALSLASATTSSNPSGGGEAQPAPPGSPHTAAVPGTYECFTLTSGTSLTSQCFGSADRCERERGQAATDGARTSGCAPTAPVACFQLGGDPNPSMELCAANADDCELWRLVDQDKNGKTGDVCQWKHSRTQ